MRPPSKSRARRTVRRPTPTSARRYRPTFDRLEDRPAPAVFTVTNAGDNGGVDPAAGAGTGTLRQAIVDANAATTNDTIRFAIPDGGGFPTITLAAALPALTDGA